MPMATDYELELRRQLEEPLNTRHRPFPIVDSSVLVTMIDAPFYPPYVPDSLHYHNYLEIGMCLAGCGQVFLHDRMWSFSAGSVIAAPRGVLHNQHNAGEPLTHWRYLVINEEHLLRSAPGRCQHALRELFEEIRDTGLFLESCSDDSSLDAIVKLMYDLNRREEHATAELELYVCLLLLELQRQKSRAALPSSGAPMEHQHRQPIEPALAYVYEHYKEDISIRDLARSCSMSESYFRKQFLKIMGMSPLDHVNRYRISRAMNLLRTSTDSIQNIAVRSGFSSIAAFNRNFKHHAGVSPGEWRKDRINK